MTSGKWLTNATETDAKMIKRDVERARPSSVVQIRDPKQMPLHSVAALKRMGLVGVYEHRK